MVRKRLHDLGEHVGPCQRREVAVPQLVQAVVLRAQAGPVAAPPLLELWQTNLHPIGIEVVGVGEDFAEAQTNALADLVAAIRDRYGIAEQSIIRHFDVTGKCCPAPYVDDAKWAALKARICGGSSGAAASEPADIDDLVRRTINGEFGNGGARRNALGSDCDSVQARVNEMLGCGNSNGGGADIDALARAVIRGDCGNGDERRRRLGADYGAVQRRVNEMLA